jgi:hypothetical protein
MKLVDPLIEDSQKHYRVGISIVVVVALKLSQVDLVHEGSAVGTEYRPRLLMDASHNNCLLHTF